MSVPEKNAELTGGQAENGDFVGPSEGIRYCYVKAC